MAEFGGSGAQGEQLGVGGRISAFFAPIVITRELQAVLIDDDTPTGTSPCRGA